MKPEIVYESSNYVVIDAKKVAATPIQREGQSMFAPWCDFYEWLRANHYRPLHVFTNPVSVAVLCEKPVPHTEAKTAA